MSKKKLKIKLTVFAAFLTAALVFAVLSCFSGEKTEPESTVPETTIQSESTELPKTICGPDLTETITNFYTSLKGKFLYQFLAIVFLLLAVISFFLLRIPQAIKYLRSESSDPSQVGELPPTDWKNDKERTVTAPIPSMGGATTPPLTEGEEPSQFMIEKKIEFMEGSPLT